MKKIYLLGVVGVVLICVVASNAYAGVCKTNCNVGEGVICLERGPCEPANDILLEAARDCREGGPAAYEPVSKLAFLDIFSQVLRIDRELPGVISQLSDNQRYELESKLLAEKGMNMFIGANPGDPMSRNDLTRALELVNIEDDLGVSTGLENQTFNLNNEKMVVYNPTLYVDEGKGFEMWERKENFSQSSGGARHYVAKLDNCNNARIVFGDNKNGRIPAAGSRLKAGYKMLGREDKVVTKCEVVTLLSNPAIVKSLKDKYNPAKPLTKANFADLLIRSMRLEKKLPADYSSLPQDKLYSLETALLSKSGIHIFNGANPSNLLTREELASVLYNHPVVEMIGRSDGTGNQRFELNNAGFTIYDLHAYVNEGAKDEEWERTGNFLNSAPDSRNYTVKLDSGNYASIYFGDGKNGKIPEVNSPIKVSYRLYSPVTLLTEDDIMCVLGKLKPVAEAYEPPPAPFDFTPPTDGFDDPATHI